MATADPSEKHRPVNKDEELARYKAALFKMELQWQDAISKLNDSSDNQELTQLRS